MSHKRQRLGSHTRIPGPTRTPKTRAPLWIVIALFSAAIVGFLWWNRAPRSTAASAQSSGESLAATLSSSTNRTKPEFEKLAGAWLRPDGGYVLEIRKVDNLGFIDAAYFNPDPIHVSKAVALREGGETRVFVELRDVNYPGCTYTLVYDPVSDRLAGDYFQAAIREHYEVEFTRRR